MFTSEMVRYSAAFQDRVKRLISSSRAAFREDVQEEPEVLFGRRFNSDEEVLHALVMRIPPGTHPGTFEKYLQENPAQLRRLIWLSLRFAAETDWNYAHGKEWGDEPK